MLVTATDGGGVFPLLYNTSVKKYAEDLNSKDGNVVHFCRLYEAEDSPIGSNSDMYYQIYKMYNNWNDKHYIRVIANDVRTNNTYIMSMTNGVWGEWQKIYTGDLYKTQTITEFNSNVAKIWSEDDPTDNVKAIRTKNGNLRVNGLFIVKENPTYGEDNRLFKIPFSEFGVVYSNIAQYWGTIANINKQSFVVRIPGDGWVYAWGDLPTANIYSVDLLIE